MNATWILFGAPVSGTYEVESSWPPPAKIRAVYDGNGYTAVLDLPDDMVLLGEQVVEYELSTYGFKCGRGGKTGRAPFATYFRVGLAPQAKMRIAARAASGLSAVA